MISLKEEKDLFIYFVNRIERRKNPYLFKIDKSGSTPIYEFFKLENKKVESKIISLDEMKIALENIQNKKTFQQDNNKIKTTSDNKIDNSKKEKVNQTKVTTDNSTFLVEIDDLKEIKNEQIKKHAEKIKKDNNNIAIIVTVKNIKDMITIFFESTDQTLRCAALCKDTDIFNIVVNKLFERAPGFKEYSNIFICDGNKINDYKSLKENKIKDGAHIVLIKQDEDDED